MTVYASAELPALVAKIPLTTGPNHKDGMWAPHCLHFVCEL